MSFNNNTSQDLSRYSIGEMVDLSGVSTFYDAGSSKWLRSAQWTAESNLTTSIKTTLAAAGTQSQSTVAISSDMDQNIANNYIPYVTNYVQRLSASSISVIQCDSDGSNIRALVLSPSSTQLVTIASNCYTTNAYNNYSLISDNTKFYCYYMTSTTALALKTSTDGITWTTESLSGLPTIGIPNAGSESWPSWITETSDTGVLRQVQSPSYGFITVLLCGARFLMVNSNGANTYTTSTSTDGITWSGDTTTAVLGGALTASGSQMNFYRNGNNCYLNASTTVFRKTTDGGVTWSNVSGGVATTTPYLLKNTTDPAKLLQVTAAIGTSAYYSADSGATWSASRTLPLSSTRYGLAYKGSVVLISGPNGLWRSADDGVTWNQISLPFGTLGVSGTAMADSNRFYFNVYGQAQILTSIDGLTWTIRTTPSVVSATTMGIAEFSANVVFLKNSGSSGYGQLFTTDGGVTWTMGSVGKSDQSYNYSGSYIPVSPDGPYGGMCFSTRGSSAAYLAISNNSLVAKGSHYRTSATAITPLRTNAQTFIRVG